MTLRLLWSLRKAAPAVLRHIGGYGELAIADLEQMQRDVGARIAAAAIVGLCAFFLLFCACLLVLALTWDTPHRVAAIAWMGGAFVVVALLAMGYRAKVVGSHAPFLASVRREWQEDKTVLEHLFTREDHTDV